VVEERARERCRVREDGRMVEGVGDGAAASSQTRPGRRRRTPSADVERELIGAAEAVLARDGIAGLTVRAIAEEAGIAQTTVYNRYGEKKALIEELMIRILDRATAVYASGDEPDMRDRLIGTALRFRAFYLENPNFFEIMYEMPFPRREARQEVHQHAAASMAALRGIVELAAAAGVISVRESAHSVTQQLWWAMHGAVSLELKDLIVTPDRDASYRAYLETFLRGLA
jgi:AcrR family transcriptional regulator